MTLYCALILFMLFSPLYSQVCWSTYTDYFSTTHSLFKAPCPAVVPTTALKLLSLTASGCIFQSQFTFSVPISLITRQLFIWPNISISVECFSSLMVLLNFKKPRWECVCVYKRMYFFKGYLATALLPLFPPQSKQVNVGSSSCFPHAPYFSSCSF